MRSGRALEMPKYFLGRSADAVGVFLFYRKLNLFLKFGCVAGQFPVCLTRYDDAR